MNSRWRRREDTEMIKKKTASSEDNAVSELWELVERYLQSYPFIRILVVILSFTRMHKAIIAIIYLCGRCIFTPEHAIVAISFYAVILQNGNRCLKLFFLI